MTHELEDQLRDEMSRRAEDVAPDRLSAIAANVVERGQRARRRKRAGVVGAAAALVIAAPLIALSLADDERTTVRETPPAGVATPRHGNPTLMTSPNPPTGLVMQAVVSGVLRVNAEGCFTLDDAVILAPYGSTVAADGQGINLAGIGEFRVGQRVRAGGGHYDQNMSKSAWPEPMRCVPAGGAPSFAVPQSSLSRSVTTPGGTRYEVTACGYLSPPPRDIEYDSVVNAEAGLATIYFTVENVSDEYTIDYRNDEYCRTKPRFRELILHVTENVPESRGW